MKWNVTIFNQQVSLEIKSWPKGILGKYLRIVDLISIHGPNLGPPITKPLKNGLFEIRVKAKEGIARAFFCYYHKNEIVVLHGFIKKTNKTPKKELEIALKRMKEL